MTYNFNKNAILIHCNNTS